MSEIICDTLDLLGYSSRYQGMTKFLRLLHIANTCSNLRTQSFRLLIEELLQNKQVQFYLNVIDSAKKFRIELNVDLLWIQQTESQNEIHRQKLDNDLLTAKATQSKESIRLVLNELGFFYHSIGHLHEAIKYFIRTKEFSSTTKHMVELVLNAMSTHLDLNESRSLNQYLNRADESSMDLLPKSKLNCITGIMALKDSNFLSAARYFLSISKELIPSWGNFNSSLSPEDVPLYGVLCALSSIDRLELKRIHRENKDFKSYLELDPEIRVLFESFVQGRYGECLTHLRGMTPRLRLDIHLSSPLDSLLSIIQEKIILAYLTPYSTISLIRMSESLCMSLSELKIQLVSLIVKGQLSAKIDSHSGTLVRNDQELLTRKKNLETILNFLKNHEENLKLSLFRMNLLKQKVIVKKINNKDSKAMLKRMGGMGLSGEGGEGEGGEGEEGGGFDLEGEGEEGGGYDDEEEEEMEEEEGMRMVEESFLIEGGGGGDGRRVGGGWMKRSRLAASSSSSSTASSSASFPHGDQMSEMEFQQFLLQQQQQQNLGQAFDDQED